MFGKLGTQELLVILLIVTVIFGPTQLPKLSKMFGSTMKEFKRGLEDKESTEQDS